MINPLLLILQSISGGVAGYITNKYAVNMLFKEYTPLKLGGVVKKNKEKFIDEISTLVEKDIINGKTLKEHIHGEEFKKQLDVTVEEFWNSGLKEAFNDVKIKDISYFEESKKSIMEFTEAKMKLISDKLLKNIVDNIEITEILSAKHIVYITDIVYEEILKYIKSDDKVSILLKDIYHQNNNLILKDIINEDVKIKIESIIEELIINSLENIFDDEEKLLNILGKIYEAIDIDEIINSLFKTIASNTLNDYFSPVEKKQISSALFAKGCTFINSDKGTDSLKNILNEIIKIAKELDFTLYKLLPEESAINLSRFIEEITIKVIPSISQWIRFNKNEVNEIIEESIDESIEGMDGSIKRIIVQKVRESLFSDISEKASVVDKIISYIDEYEMNEESVKKISQEIITYLKSNKVKDIIGKLEEANIISESKIMALSKLIMEKINIHGEKILSLLVEAVFSKKISSLINEENIGLLKIKVKEQLILLICNERKEILSFLQLRVVNIINDKINEAINMPVKNLLSEKEFTKLSEKANRSLLHLLKDSKREILEPINRIIISKVREIDLIKIAESEKELLGSSMINLILTLEEEMITRYSENTLDEFIEDICNKDKLILVSKEKLYNYIDNNIEEILDGNIKNIIYDNLIKFNEDEICELAQSFMGNELKPLSVFGGILGIVVGGIYGLFYGTTSISGFSGSVASTIISCIIMAMIGVGTNVIALKMLFYPYKRNKFLAKIPFLRKFSLGYIPAHKDTMARGIGHVIDEELLNGERVKMLLTSKKDMFKGYLISSISESNYKVIMDAIREKKEIIVDYLYDGMKKNIENNKKKIAYKSVEGIGSINVGKILKSRYISKIVLDARKLTVIFSEKTADYLANKMKSDKKCKEFIKEEQLIKIREDINNSLKKVLLNNGKSILNEEKIQKMIFKGEDKYQTIINNNLSGLISSEKIESLRKYIKDKSMLLIFNESKNYLEKGVSEFLEKEINGDNTIGNVFAGKIAEYIDSNIPKLSRYIISKGESYLKANKSKFSEKVRGEITSGLNFLERGAYVMFGGDDIVNRCIDTIIDIKVPIFLDNKYLEITSLVQSTLSYSIYPTPIKSLQLKAKEINCSKILDSIYISLNKSIYIKEEIEEVIDESINIILSENLKEFLLILDLDSLKDICYKFNRELNNIIKLSNDNLVKNLEAIVKCLDEIIDEGFIQSIKETSINKVMLALERKDVVECTEAILNIVVSNEEFATLIEKIANEFYEDVVKRVSFNAIIDEEYSKECVEEYIEAAFNSKSFNEVNKEIINLICEEIINDGFSFIKEDTKDDVICRAIEAVLNVTFNNTSKLLKAVNIKQITMEQIAIMESKEIHIMFNGFAGDFFKKLYLYGSFGAIFGINLWFSIAWGIIEEINNRRVA